MKLFELVLLGVSLASCGTALGQTRANCPVDATPISLPAAAWNLAGGVDSDGCGYAVDGQGQVRVVGLDQVAVCRGCGAALRRDHLLSLKLTPGQVDKVKAALEQARRPGEPGKVTVSRVHELAVVTYRALGPKPFALREDLEAFVGRLLLRAAWAARGEAVLKGSDAGYRPKDLAQARLQLRALEVAVTRDIRQGPEIVGLDAQLSRLEDTRRQLTPLLRDAPLLQRLRIVRALGQQAEVEQRLLKQKGELLERAQRDRSGLSKDELELAWVRALIRFGDRERWANRLKELGRQPDFEPEVRRLQRVCEEEARLLGLAGQTLEAAAKRTSGRAKARLLFLAGDAARRQGRRAEAQRLFRAAVALAPQSEAGRRAAALLSD